MNQQQLKLINDLCKILDDNYNINSGGCCYVAYILAKNLEKYHISYKVAFSDLYQCKSGSSIINESEIEVKYNKYSCCHTWIIVSDYHINGFDNYENFDLTANLTSKELLTMYNKGKWNDEYSTSNNKLIRRLISSTFKSLCQK